MIHKMKTKYTKQVNFPFKNIIYVIILFTTSIQNSIAQNEVKTRGSKNAINNVKIVGKGTISSTDFEFNQTRNKEDNIAYFTKALLPDWRRMSIVVSTKDKNGNWSTPKLAKFSGKYRDADPFISPDQRRLIFISDRPSQHKSKSAHYGFWFINLPLTNNSIPYPVINEFNKEIQNPVYPSLSKDNTLFFSSGTRSGSNIYYSNFDGRKYGPAVSLNFNNDNYFDLDPVIAPDKSFIIFVSNNRNGKGGKDLFVSFNNNGIWSKPKNLGDKINTRANEGQPGLSSDGKTLFFSSLRVEKAANYKPRDKKIDNNQLLEELKSIHNGLPNIWQADISNIQLLNNNKSH